MKFLVLVQLNRYIFVIKIKYNKFVTKQKIKKLYVHILHYEWVTHTYIFTHTHTHAWYAHMQTHSHIQDSCKCTIPHRPTDCFHARGMYIATWVFLSCSCQSSIYVHVLQVLLVNHGTISAKYVTLSTVGQYNWYLTNMTYETEHYLLHSPSDYDVSQAG